MRLLVVTQAVDKRDPVLGFFHRWLEELATCFEKVSVICLIEGEHSLPQNVRVYSLGKEKGGATKFVYATRFLSLIRRLRHEYDAVFVHMNEEYVLLGAPFWRWWGTRIYMWRNHYAGGLFTRAAIALCDKVFCTSAHSFTARFKKTVLMPVGIDSDTFRPVPGVLRVPRSILSLGRIAPSKRLELLLGALAVLARERVQFSADIYGGALPEDSGYLEKLKSLITEGGLSDKVSFKGPIENDKTPEVYSAHELFVNTSRSGMYDKTLFEAASCGCTVLSSSDDFALQSGGSVYDSVKTLADGLREYLEDGRKPRTGAVSGHSLAALGEALQKEMSV